MKSLRTGAAAFFFAAALAAGGTASAEMMETTVELAGSQEVPPVETNAMGEVDVTFDTETRVLTWELDYEGLSGDATAAHFHGPADPGENAPPVIPLENFADGAEGSAELPEELATALMEGQLYFNLHTAANPGGEIRGQVTMAQ